MWRENCGGTVSEWYFAELRRGIVTTAAELTWDGRHLPIDLTVCVCVCVSLCPSSTLVDQHTELLSQEIDNSLLSAAMCGLNLSHTQAGRQTDKLACTLIGTIE